MKTDEQVSSYADHNKQIIEAYSQSKVKSTYSKRLVKKVQQDSTIRQKKVTAAQSNREAQINECYSIDRGAFLPVIHLSPKQAANACSELTTVNCKAGANGQQIQAQHIRSVSQPRQARQ